MILYPAIDIMGGRAVRLVQGRFEDATTYHDDPLEAAQSWVDAGARYLHVVDLDGAKEGEPRSIEHLRRIVQGTGVPVQYGGGLRTVDAVRDALRAGAERAIVGTAAFRDIDFLDEILATFGPRIVVSVDVRGGFISTAGWTKTTEMPAEDAIRRLQDRGVASFVYTNVDRDGKLEGPDTEEVRRVAEAVRGRFLYSGGIGRREDLQALAGLRQVNLSGVIVGKALYEKRFTIAEGQAALDGRLTSPPGTICSVLLEREQTLDALSRAVGDAAAGHGSVVLVTGEAGIGKTSLIRAFAAEAPDDRARLLLSACDDLMAPRTLGPLRDAASAADPLAAALAPTSRSTRVHRLLDELAAEHADRARGRGRPLGRRRHARRARLRGAPDRVASAPRSCSRSATTRSTRTIRCTASSARSSAARCTGSRSRRSRATPCARLCAGTGRRRRRAAPRHAAATRSS